MPLAPSYSGNRAVAVRGKTQRLLSGIYHQQWINPTTASTTAYRSTGIAGPNTTTISVTRTGGAGIVAGNFSFDGTLALGSPDFPRNVVITVTHGSSVVAESGVISGVDVYGKNISEAWSVTAGTTSKTFTGKKSFARVDSVTITAASDASANTNVIGNGTVLGLDCKITVQVAGAAAVPVLKEIVANAVVTNGVFVGAGTASTDDPRGTYAPNSAPNGSTIYDVWYISDDPENSAP